MKNNGINLFFETSAQNGSNVIKVLILLIKKINTNYFKKRKAFEEAAKLIFLRYISNESFKQSIKSLRSK